MTSLRTACAAALVFALVAPAAAQPADGQTPATPFTAGFRDGFILQTDDGDYRLQLGIVAQLDGRWVTDDPQNAVVDTFSVRKARPVIAGRLARYFDFQLVSDFGGGAAVLQDAFVDLRFSPALRVRMGKAKSPIGYEVLIGDPFVLLPERSLASSLVPNRDVGVHVLGDLAAGRLSYQAAVLNGLPDGASSTSDLDTNDGKDLAGRIVLQPFRRAQDPGPLNGLGFALAGSVGEQVGALPSFRTSVGQRYFGYDAAATAAGTRRRVTPAVFLYMKSFGAFAEYMRSTQAVTRAGVERELTNDAWDVTGSWVLTGEAATERGVRPSHDFDPSSGYWGALQLLSRYSELTVDRTAFDDGFAASGSSRKARQFTIGANWYPVAFIKYYVAYEQIRFDGPFATTRIDEKSIIVRAQFAF